MKLRTMLLLGTGLIILVPGVFLIASAFRQENPDFFADKTAEAKDLYGQNSLPATNGKMRPGIRFDVQALPGLSTFNVIRDEVFAASDRAGATRSLVVTPTVGAGRLYLSFYVSNVSVADARDSIFNVIAKKSTMISAIRGDGGPLNIAVGDFNFLFHSLQDVNVGDPRTIFNMAFARNNIAVFLNFDRDITTVPNLIAIATYLDQQILSEPETDDLSKSKLKPQIQKFELAGGGKRIKKGTVTPITLQVKPGSGKDDSIQIFFTADDFGQVVQEKTDGKTRYQYAAGISGNATLAVVVVNDRLLLSTAQILITITD